MKINHREHRGCTEGTERKGKYNSFAFPLWFSLCVLCGFSFLTAAVHAQTDISRPLRQVQFRLTDHPASRNMLPSPSVADLSLSLRSFTENSLLSPEALEQALTQQYIKQYSSPGGIAWLNAVIRRGSPYIPFIRREIEERGLPAELLYLPVIESGYLSTAVSKSGAMGLWQFMKNSIGGYDIKISDWADERRDFWKATQGALRKLEDNYKTLGDWPLALAAYNAGLGGVSRTIKQTGLNDFWALSEKKALKAETIHYVPKLLAVAHIMSRPRQYGVDIWQEEAPEWARIPLGRAVDLSILAAETGIDINILKSGNAELNYNVTPPDASWLLKIPAENAPAVAAVMERKDLNLIKNYIYTISYGDTLSALALHYGISVDLIQNANPGLKSKYLQIGNRILIPALKDVGPYQAGQSAAINVSASAGGGSFEGTHLVKKGETLWSIALAHDIAPDALAQANNMALNDTLSVGRNLKVPIIVNNE
ncbi:lytic transglycosylase [Spirochaetia bacterium]|nr:lytic transglycosylase [Spirochaetia bacterium]